jgi:hypothetical protein
VSYRISIAVYKILGPISFNLVSWISQRFLTCLFYTGFGNTVIRNRKFYITRKKAFVLCSRTGHGSSRNSHNGQNTSIPWIVDPKILRAIIMFVEYDMKYFVHKMLCIKLSDYKCITWKYLLNLKQSLFYDPRRIDLFSWKIGLCRLFW